MVLDWLEPSEYDTTYFCSRDPDTGEASIRALSDLDGLSELAAERSIAQLFADGWMEDAP